MATPDSTLHALAVDLTLAVGQLVRRLRAETDPGGLTLSQLSAMARLERHGPTTTADLARAESMKPQSMGAVLASLEQEGLVQRQSHPTDGRQILFALTPLGASVRSRRGRAKHQWVEAALSRLGPEERQALASAIPLISRLDGS
jgi:DNA-binding MarR family transcriptional regulator